MKYLSSKLMTLALVFILALVLGACQEQPAEPDKITVQLSWFHTVEFAGFYVADQKGFYAEENLEVTLLPGGPETFPIAEVTAGKAQFGVSAADEIIRAQAEGQALLALSCIFQENPLVVISLAEAGIRHPEDLVGKTVGVISPALDTTWDIQFIALLNQMGIDPASLNFVANEAYHGADDLLSGRMDAASGFFSTNEPIVAIAEGYPINSIYYSDYGVAFYNNLIFAEASLVEQQPDLVQRFMRATLKGYLTAIENPEEATDFTLLYDNTLDLAFQLASMQTQIPLIDTGNAALGWMDIAVWQNAMDILLAQNILSEAVDLEKVFTNQFIEQSK